VARHLNQRAQEGDMTDYTRTPDTKPWSRDLNEGDLLTYWQAIAVDATRLSDFGLELVCTERLVWPRHPTPLHPRHDAIYRVQQMAHAL
jgi:hypothetical protein